jgi:hypothetical protein
MNMRHRSQRTTDPKLHFKLMSRAEKASAIRRMAAQNWSDYGISSATGLAVEQVRQILSSNDVPS